MQALDTDTSLDAIEDLDFDPEVRCDIPEFRSPCDNPAAWYVHHKCCGKTYPMCAKHYAASMPKLNRSSPRCAYCLEPIGPGRVTFTPVGKG